MVPIINENDTVSISEIQFGDNDNLAAMVNNLLDNSLLIVLSVIDGLFDGDPDHADSQVLPLIEQWDAKLMALATDTRSRRGKGGMQSKLQAIRRVTEVGESVIIANGRTPDVLDRILAAEEIGTLFLAQGKNVPAWKRWIGYTIEPAGRLRVDHGARRALNEQGRSLLAIGVESVDGQFDRGELVSLLDQDGREFARGLTNYTSAEAEQIRGRRTPEIVAILGEQPYDSVIHRDNLTVFT